MKATVVLALALWVSGSTMGFAASPSDGEGAARPDPDSLKGILASTEALVASPLHWDRGNWLEFGGTLAAITLAHHYDDSVRSHFTRNSTAALDGKDTHELQDFVPAAAMLVAPLVFDVIADDNSNTRMAVVSMGEAAIFGAASATLFRAAAGRERPNQTTDSSRWRASGSSFPSLHVTVAFAIGSVLAQAGSDSARWFTRLTGFGLAGYTAYSRLKHNQHWLSDTVAGAALGTAIGTFVAHRAYDSDSSGVLSVAPTVGGALVSWRRPL